MILISAKISVFSFNAPHYTRRLFGLSQADVLWRRLKASQDSRVNYLH